MDCDKALEIKGICSIFFSLDMLPGWLFFLSANGPSFYVAELFKE